MTPYDVVKAGRLLRYGGIRLVGWRCVLITDKVIDGVASVGHRWVIVTPCDGHVEPITSYRNCNLGINVS
eukprot:COSAG02_NODE_1734_length_11163_cov_43.814262_4_plen_70_part_00